MDRRRALAGERLYEIACTECGALTPSVSSPDGCVDLDEELVCGHDPIRRDLVFVEGVAAVRR